MNEILASRGLALPAVLPGGLLLAFVILRLGRRAFPIKLFGAAVLGGVLAGLALASLAFLTAKLQPTHDPFWQPVVNAFIKAGLVEETAKLVAAFIVLRPHFLKRTARDLILGVASVALGFALVENVLYVSRDVDHWQAVAVSRAAMSVPTHAFLGLVLGHAMAVAQNAPSRFRYGFAILRGLILAVLLHGAFDLPIMLGERAPLYPGPVIDLADALSLSAPTLLGLIFSASFFALCCAAMRAILALDRLEIPGSRPPLNDPLSSSWLMRFICARLTGQLLGSILMLAAILIFGISFAALLRGSTPMLPLAACGMCFAPATLAIALFVEAPQPRPVAGPERQRAGVTLILGQAVAAVLVAAIGVFALRAPLHGVLANVLVESGGFRALNGDLDAAIENYNSALSLKPDFVAAFAARAEVNRLYQRYDRSLADIDKALAINTKTVALWQFRSEVHAALHDQQMSAADLDQALALKPDDPGLLSARAQAAFQLHDNARADADFARALSINPDLPDVRANHGFVLLAQGKLDAAFAEFDAVLRVNPNADGARFARGRISYYRGDYASAIGDFAAANAQSAQAYPALWLFLAQARRDQDAHAGLVFGTARVSQQAWPAPIIRLFLGRLSADAVRASVKDNDQACEADFYIGELLVLRQSIEPAKALLRRAADQCPEGFIEREGAVAELRKLGSDQKRGLVRDWLEALGAPRPAPTPLVGQAVQAATPPKGDFARGVLALENGDADQAIAAFDAAIKGDPTDIGAYKARAQAFDLKGDIERSILDYGTALGIDADDTEALSGRGMAYFYLGRYQESVVDLRRAAEKNAGPYQQLWYYLASRRAGEGGEGALRPIGSEVAPGEWPYPIIQFFLGPQAIDDVARAATKPDQLCEAKFFLGEWHLLRGETADATSLLRDAAAICPKTYVEYSAALAELKQLN